MELFKSSDEAFARNATRAEARRNAVAKARLNRLMTLGAAVVFCLAFAAMAWNRAPSADVFGFLTLVNFGLFLKSDSDVKLLLVAQALDDDGAQPEVS
jgi:hypothetical protein